MRELLFPLLLLAILPLAGSSEDPGEERGGEPSLGGAVCSGTGLSAAAVGRPSRFTIQLLRRDGSNVTGGGDGKRFTVFTSPPPLHGAIQDRGDGRYEVELYHEWVTKTSPEHGLSNVTVLVEGKHACGSPFIFGTDHQFAVHRRKGSPRIEPPALVPSRESRESREASAGSAGAYATLVATEEFALGAVVLAHSLRSVGARYPLVAMVTARIDDETEALLRHAGMITRRVDGVSNPFANFKKTLEEKAWEQVYTKTQAWSLVDFDRIVFLDADQLVVQNIDELFDRPIKHDFAAVPDVAPPIFFNSGFMLLRPSAKTVASMQEQMHVLPSYDDGDQGFLNAFFSQEWDRLPYTYNFMKSKTGNPEAYYWLLDSQWWSIKVVHMVGVKPWKCSRFRDCGGFPERVIGRLWALWWDAFLAMCEQAAPSLTCVSPVPPTSLPAPSA